jgi:hypothetical protein
MAGLFQDLRRTADMVVMAVGEQHMGHTLGGLFPATLPDGIADEIRIDEDFGIARLDAECGMAIPGQFHIVRPRFFLAARIEASSRMSKESRPS